MSKCPKCDYTPITRPGPCPRCKFFINQPVPTLATSPTRHAGVPMRVGNDPNRGRRPTPPPPPPLASVPDDVPPEVTPTDAAQLVVAVVDLAAAVRELVDEVRAAVSVARAAAGEPPPPVVDAPA